jgi:uracil DNA glycosylase
MADRVVVTMNIYGSLRAVMLHLIVISTEDVKVVILGQDPYHGPGQVILHLCSTFLLSPPMTLNTIGTWISLLSPTWGSAAPELAKYFQ